MASNRGEVRFRIVADTKEFESGIKVAEKEFTGFINQLGASAGPLGDVAAAMGPIGMVAAAAFGAATLAVSAFAKATIDGAVAAVQFAGNLSDLSVKTGISGEALQILGAAGQLVGVTMDEAATAVMKMQQHMVTAPEDFKQLGLAIEDLQKLAPEKQFEAVGKAILAIEDPAQRTAATISFFGKSGQEAMKLLSVDMAEAGEQAERLGNIMADSTRQALDDLGDSVTVLSTTWDHLWMNLGGAVAETPAVREAVESVTEALGDLSRYVQENSAEIQDLITMAVVPMASALVQLLQGVQFMVSAFIQWKTAVDELRYSLQGGWLESAVNALGYGLGAPRPDATGSISVVGGANPDSPPPRTWTDPAKLTKELKEQAKAAEEAAKAAAAYEKQLAELTAYGENLALQYLMGTPEEWREVYGEINSVGGEVDDLTATLMRLEEGNFIEQSLFQLIDKGDQVVGILDDLDGMFDALGVDAESSLRTTVQGLADVADGAVKGAQAFAQFSSGDILGGISSAIGAVTSLASGLGNLFGGGPSAAEILAHDIMVMQTEFINASGGLDALEAAAEEAGVSLEGMWNARTVEEYEAAIDSVNAALALHESAVDKTKEAMERWGLTAADMGPAFAQKLLHESFTEIYQDLLLLEAGGADVTALLAGPMGDSIQELVQQAQASGAELPEFMRPWIESLITSGDLVDANGDAITDVSQLNFTEDLTAQVGNLIEEIHKLVNALLGIPAEGSTWVHVNTTHTNDNDEAPRPGGWDGDPETPWPASSGFFSPSLPHDQLFQAHQGERVQITPSGMNSGGGSGVVDLSPSSIRELSRATRDAIMLTGA